LCDSRCGQFDEAKNSANDLASSNCKEQSLAVNCQPVHETNRKFDEAGKIRAGKPITNYQLPITNHQ